ncbi:hypothetical protein C8F01DRAFT_1174871 [Mycena amicta]|nr:hypothetical protein C8F01DRAFT_1174871 [Mycena amicta]
MPSLFSRARTASTPTPSSSSKSKSKQPPQLPLILPPQSLPASGARLPALSLGVDEFGMAGPEAGYGAVGFLPTSVPPDLATPFPASQVVARPPYGLLSPARDTVLGLTDAARLATTVCAALERTGVATPFVFSSLALDARRSGVVRLAHAFLASCHSHQDDFGEEARFAAAHELALCLRWGLSKVVRVEGGRELRGLLSWTWYERWKAEEAGNAYPTTAFSTFIDSLPAQLAPILRPLFALCTKLVAHSSASGHTPPSLASVLSPLLFGLSPPPLSNTPPAASYPTPTSPSGKSSKKDKGEPKERDKDDPESLLFPTTEDFSTFNAVYEEYLRGARAAEHLLLACIREDVTTGGSALGGPTRLREWVGMYPASVDTGGNNNPSSQSRAAGARRGAKTVRVVHVRRNVRSYSSDLVKTGSSWAESGSEWSASRAWRTILAGGAGAPRYTDAYRKRMDFGVGVHPSTSSLSSSTSSATPFSSHSLTSPSSTSLASTTESAAPGAFRSLTDLQWGAFESLGFGHGSGAGVGGFEMGAGAVAESAAGGIDGRLKFDLTENARAERAAKRETLSWADFSSAGFSRSDAPLSATLQFTAPLTLGRSPSSNGPLNAELTRKLRKAHKALPAFGWDTNPVVGSEEVIEEAFIDVFCDLLYGGGWMERAVGVGGPSAELAKECSWALVDYKSRSGGQQDPGATLVLYEEFVPREYRLALAGVAPPGTRRRLPSFFTPSTSMLRAQNATKMISLSSPRKQPQSPQQRPPDPPPGAAPPVGLGRTRSDESTETATATATKRQSASARFRLPGGMHNPVPSPGSNGGPRVKPGMPPAESAPVEFQTRLAVASESDDSDVDEYEDNKDREAARQRRRESASDAWVDILVGSMAGRRMGGQDAVMSSSSASRGTGQKLRTTGSGLRVRPEADRSLANMEVAQALAAETMKRTSIDVDDDYYRDSGVRDSDVVEIERVPRKESSEPEPEESDIYGQATDEDDDDESILTPGAHVHPVLAQARQARRAGYFDLHPERRPPSAADSSVEDDPRSLLSAGDSDDDEPAPLVITPRNLDGLPSPIRPLPTPTRPTHEEDVVMPTNGHGHAIAAPKPSQPTTASKTSALIDMFREREQRGTSSSPTPPSRLPVPVRTATGTVAGSSPVSPQGPRPTPSKAAPAPPPAPAPEPVVVPLPSPPPPPAPAPAKSSPPLLSPAEIEAEARAAAEGRGSPARYVHGAPLHNVLEEEEEE